MEKLERDSATGRERERRLKRRAEGNTGGGKGNRAGRVTGHIVTAKDREAIGKIYQECGNMAEVARRTGWDYTTIWKHLKGSNRDILAEKSTVDVGPPKLWAELSEQQKGWLTNFGEFRRHFFQRETPPFHQWIADEVSRREHQRTQVLTPPGFGKSVCFSTDYPIWEMCRQRAQGNPWGCLLISKGSHMAKAFLSQIKRELETNIELQLAFGRFKPEYPDAWSQDRLTVEGFPIRKEPTFIAAGAGSAIYGWRVHLIVSDDIVDSENSATPEKAEKLLTWFADELVSRLEPDGVILNIGTRFSLFDLHGKLLRQRDDDGDPIWHVVLFRAHDDARCSGEHCTNCKEGCKHDTPQPDGCLLWPARFGYRKLRQLRAGQYSTSRFEFLYNQYELPDEGALVKPEWSEKCKNHERLFWEFPQGCRVMCTLDPSPTQWAVAEAWAYNADEDMRYLIGMWRKRRVLSPEYLALIKSWTLKLRALGQEPIWVVEINAAQRWLLQDTAYLMARAEMGLTVIPHTTGRNKSDPELGIQSLAPVYEFGKVDLPWAGADERRLVGQLLEELHSYPLGETDDAVLAEWFCEHNIRRLRNASGTQWLDQAMMPPWLLERRELVDLHTGQRLNCAPARPAMIGSHAG
jgi:hypothetical protein